MLEKLSYTTIFSVHLFRLLIILAKWPMSSFKDWTSISHMTKPSLCFLIILLSLSQDNFPHTWTTSARKCNKKIKRPNSPLHYYHMSLIKIWWVWGFSLSGLWLPMPSRVIITVHEMPWKAHLSAAKGWQTILLQLESKTGFPSSLDPFSSCPKSTDSQSP